MKTLFTLILLVTCLVFYGQGQQGGACLYMLPGDSTIVCNIYGNGGLPNQVACYNEADAAGAIPMDCYAYLSCAASTYPDLGGNGCFYAGTGSCGGSGSVCDLIALPVELIEFNAEKSEDKNIITWSTASEANSDYFEVRIFNDSLEIYERLYLSASGNSTMLLHYKVIHHYPIKARNYYQLVQYDFDGRFKEYDIVSIDNTIKLPNLMSRFDMMGRQLIDNTLEHYSGIYIEVYDDGTFKKLIK